MPNYESLGFFKLESPFDLLEKLNHDLARLRHDPTDSYAAFDFFVTATHMPEWIKNQGWTFSAPMDPRLRAAFEVCGALGNGAKHFILERKFNNRLEVREEWVQPGWMQEDMYQRGGLHVVLNVKDAAVFGTDRITALALATEIHAFWERDLNPRLNAIEE